MPRSKTRKHHHEQRQSTTLIKSGKNKSAVGFTTIFLALIGLGIAFFATGSSIIWLPVGAIAGGVAGYFAGKQFDKTFSKK